MTTTLSRTSECVTPDGARYPLPDEAQTATEVASLETWASEAGRPVVVVQGIGFVGFAMAIAVAAVRDEAGQPPYSVIGVDLPHPATFWKSCYADAGRLPVETTDEKLAQAHQQAVERAGNLRFSWVEETYALANIVVEREPGR